MIRYVHGYENYLCTQDGVIISKTTGNVLAPFLDRNGYKRVSLYRNGKKKNHYVHRVVFESFFGCIPVGYEVDHKDNKRDNNHLGNFQLLTRQQNMRKVHDSQYREKMST